MHGIGGCTAVLHVIAVILNTFHFYPPYNDKKCTLFNRLLNAHGNKQAIRDHSVCESEEICVMM